MDLAVNDPGLEKVTYWLYFGSEPVGSVRMIPGVSEERIRQIAVERHRRCPLLDAGVLPFEHELRLWHSKIRMFEGGR